MQYQMVRSTSQADIKKVQDHLIEFNSQFMPDEMANKFVQVCLVVKDEHGKICGGLNAEICWNFMEITMVFVEESLRTYGYGRKLVEQAEQIAIEENCDFIKLDTLEFQAKEFYEKLGYEVFGVINHVAKEYKHYYMKKEL